jgi:hypothetical protein
MSNENNTSSSDIANSKTDTSMTSRNLILIIISSLLLLVTVIALCIYLYRRKQAQKIENDHRMNHEKREQEQRQMHDVHNINQLDLLKISKELSSTNDNSLKKTTIRRKQSTSSTRKEIDDLKFEIINSNIGNMTNTINNTNLFSTTDRGLLDQTSGNVNKLEDINMNEKGISMLQNAPEIKLEINDNFDISKRNSPENFVRVYETIPMDNSPTFYVSPNKENDPNKETVNNEKFNFSEKVDEINTIPATKPAKRNSTNQNIKKETDLGIQKETLNEKKTIVKGRIFAENKRYQKETELKPQNAEMSFMQTIQRLDSKEDKIKQFIMNSPKFITGAGKKMIKAFNLESSNSQHKESSEEHNPNIHEDKIVNFTQGNMEDDESISSYKYSEGNNEDTHVPYFGMKL